MTQPEHTVRPAFDNARDKIMFLERRLTPEEKTRYDGFREQQKEDRNAQKKRADEAKAHYDDVRKRQAKAALQHNTPILIRDPQLAKLAERARNETQSLTSLDLAQRDARLQFLEKLDKARSENTKHTEQEKSAALEQSRGRARSDFGRAGRAGHAKTNFSKASKLEAAKEKAIQQAMRKIEGRESLTAEFDRQRDDLGRER